LPFFKKRQIFPPIATNGAFAAERLGLQQAPGDPSHGRTLGGGSLELGIIRKIAEKHGGAVCRLPMPHSESGT